MDLQHLEGGGTLPVVFGWLLATPPVVVYGKLPTRKALQRVACAEPHHWIGGFDGATTTLR